MAAKHDPSKGAGRSWKSFFGKETKEEVEARMTELGYTWEWGQNDLLVATSPILSAVRVAPGTTKHVFFNQLVASLANASEFSGGDGGNESISLDRVVRLGDGSPIPIEVGFGFISYLD